MVINSNWMNSVRCRPRRLFSQQGQDLLVVGSQRARRWLIVRGILGVHRTREFNYIISQIQLMIFTDAQHSRTN